MVRRREDQGDDAMMGRADTDNTPWYVRAISYFGVPAAIALYLVYYLTTAMPTKAEVLMLGDELRVHVSSTQSDLSDIKRILLVTCVNAAATDAKRMQCLGSRPGGTN